jgi:predicted acetyltransferase
MAAAPEIEIREAARGERPIVERLLQLYTYDFSEFAGSSSLHNRVGPDGRFPYPWLDLYWTEEGREPFLLRVDGDLAGFVFLNRWSASGKPVDRSIAEFFVMRKYRREGIGTRMAHGVLRDRPGRWEIPVARYNAPALAFWQRVVHGLDPADLEEISGDGERWSGPIFRFRVD